MNHNGVVKGVAETIKALEAGKVKIVFLAGDCDNTQYTETLEAIANQYKVRVVSIPTWIELRDFCKLGMLSTNIIKIAEEKGKEAKIKPRCSSAAIIVFFINYHLIRTGEKIQMLKLTLKISDLIS